MQVDETILSDIIYETDFECPICHTVSKRKMIKVGKNKLIEIEYDLYAKYEKVNPLYYEMIVCECCGFAQINKQEEMPSYKKLEMIKEHVSMNFVGRKYSKYYTAQEAIERYKLGLLNAIVRKAKEGEKGYIALKLGWLYREIGNEVEEKRFIEQARLCFINAYQKEGCPIFELEEDVVGYLIAALSYRMENYNAANEWLVTVLNSKNTSEKVKQRCYILREMLKEQK